MCAATTRLDTFLKIHSKKPVCAQRIDDIKCMVNAHVYTRDVSVLACAKWFARTACMDILFA